MAAQVGDRLTEIQQRLAAATPGPWRWGGTVRDIRLETVNRGRIQILAPRRQGFHYPVWQLGRKDRLKETYGGVLVPMTEYAVREVSYRDDLDHVDHPDAELIANAPADLAWAVEEIGRLRLQLAQRGEA